MARIKSRQAAVVPMPYAPLTRNQAHHKERPISNQFGPGRFADAYPQMTDIGVLAAEERRRASRDKDDWLWAYE